MYQILLKVACALFKSQLSKEKLKISLRKVVVVVLIESSSKKCSKNYLVLDLRYINIQPRIEPILLIIKLLARKMCINVLTMHENFY